MDACREVAGVEPVLKWPNDLLVAGSKLAGVLAETEFSGGTLAAVVVGHRGQRGLARARRAREAPAWTTRARRRRRSAAGSCWTTCWARWRRAPAALDDAAGRRGLADEVRRHCATLGQPVRVVLASEGFTGMAVAIDDAGRLVVETGSGPRRVTAGDVVHLRPGSGRGSGPGPGLGPD